MSSSLWLFLFLSGSGISIPVLNVLRSISFESNYLTTSESYGIIGKTKEEWVAYHSCYIVEDFYMQLEPNQVKYTKVEKISENSYRVYMNIYILENWDYFFWSTATADAYFKGGAISDRNNWKIDW